MNDVAQAIQLSALDGLLLHEVLCLKINAQRLQLIMVLDHALYQFQVFRDDASLEVRTILAEVNALVRHATANVAHHYSVSLVVLCRNLEFFQLDATVPDASLTHTLSGHKRLARFGILWVVLSPVENPHVCVVSQVKWCLICRIHIIG